MRSLFVPAIAGARDYAGRYSGTSIVGSVIPGDRALDWTGANTGQIALPVGALPNSRFTVISGCVIPSGNDSGEGFDVLIGSSFDGYEPFTLRVASGNLEATTYTPSGSVSLAKPATGARVTAFAMAGQTGVSETWTVGYLDAKGVETSASGSVNGVGRSTYLHWIGAAGNAGSPYRRWNRAITWFALFDGWMSAAERSALAVNPWQLFEGRRIWVPVSAGGGAGNVGSVFASGVFRSNVLRRAA